MILEDFRKYQATDSATAKKRLLSKMLKDNEPLAGKCAQLFMSRTGYYTDSIKDDILQAARIGLIRAIERWEPERAAFSTLAYHWMRHEMQQVLQHATPISRPKSADLPRRLQDASSAFYAVHGRYPDPEEVGISNVAAERAQAADTHFVDVRGHRTPQSDRSTREHLYSETPSYEEDIDRERDYKALHTFVKKLSRTDRKEFWTGKRPDLTQKAKEYVEKRRNIR